MKYKYGSPNKYGDFPYISMSFTDDELKAILLERLPTEYNMQIVCPIEERVIADCSTLGIDSHLEAMIQSKPDKIVDRKIGDKVVQKHHEMDFSPEGMICLIRRLKEYDPSKFDHSDIDTDIVSNYSWPEDTEEELMENHSHDFWSAAYLLRSCILETLQIDDTNCY